MSLYSYFFHAVLYRLRTFWLLIAGRSTMQPRRGRGQTQLGLGVMMLASQLLNVGLDRIPPVTLATIAAQVRHICRH